MFSVAKHRISSDRNRFGDAHAQEIVVQSVREVSLKLAEKVTLYVLVYLQC